MATPDTINTMAGIAEDSPVAALRMQKPDLVAFAQGSDQALLEPANPGSFSLLERHAEGRHPLVGSWFARSGGGDGSSGRAG